MYKSPQADTGKTAMDFTAPKQINTTRQKGIRKGAFLFYLKLLKTT
nr:MAG TPA: hypothetical protein [Caudoviricetes sp.]